MSAPTLASLVRSYTALDNTDLLSTGIPSQIAHGEPVSVPATWQSKNSGEWRGG